MGRSPHPRATEHVTADFENLGQLEHTCRALASLQCDGAVFAAGLDSRADAAHWELSALLRILSVNAIAHAVLLRELIRVGGDRNLAVVGMSTELVPGSEPGSFLYTPSKVLLEAFLAAAVAEGAPCAVSILRFGYMGLQMRETAEGERRHHESGVETALGRRVAEAAVQRVLTTPTGPSVSIVQVS
jgi:short-subunit dehydrogenase